MKVNEFLAAVKDKIVDSMKLIFGESENPSAQDETKQTKQPKINLDTKLSSYAAITKMTQEMEQAKRQRQNVKTPGVVSQDSPTVYGELFSAQNPEPAVNNEKQKEVVKGPEAKKTV